jgi:hypothetical protein
LFCSPLAGIEREPERFFGNHRKRDAVDLNTRQTADWMFRTSVMLSEGNTISLSDISMRDIAGA